MAGDPGSLDPATVRLAFSVVSFWGPVLTGATMAMIGAVTALGLRSPSTIPRWLTILGVVAFVEQAHALGLKGCTVFRAGTARGQVVGAPSGGRDDVERCCAIG